MNPRDRMSDKRIILKFLYSIRQGLNEGWYRSSFLSGKATPFGNISVNGQKACVALFNDGWLERRIKDSFSEVRYKGQPELSDNEKINYATR